MEVQVLHALAGVAAAVAHHAEAALGDTLLMRDRPACFYSFGVSEPISRFNCAICLRVHIWKQD